MRGAVVSDRTIAVMTAIPQEWAAFGELLDGRHEPATGIRTGTMAGIDVVVGSTGIGKVNAARMATVLCEHFDPDVIVFTGVGGGLDIALDIGDIVIGTSSIQHDAGVLGPAGLEPYQAGHIPFFNPTDRFGFNPSPELIERCQRRLEGFSLLGPDGAEVRIVFGTILTGDQYLSDPIERDRLFGEFGAQVIEMEGAAAAQVAEHYGCDHLLVRAISDLAGERSEFDFMRFLDHVAANAAATLQRLLPAIAAD